VVGFPILSSFVLVIVSQEAICPSLWFKFRQYRGKYSVSS